MTINQTYAISEKHVHHRSLDRLWVGDTRHTRPNQTKPTNLPRSSHPLLISSFSVSHLPKAGGLRDYQASSLHLKTSLFLPLLTWPGRGQRQALSQASQHIMHAGHKVQIQGEAEEDSSRVLLSPFLSTALPEGPRTLFTTLLI